MAKSKRSIATSIPPLVKQKVWERQNGKSLFSPYIPISVEECCCHFIPRSQGGLGIEENIFGCVQRSYRNEHMFFDGNYLRGAHDPCVQVTGLTQEEMHTVVRNHLIRNYPDWDEENLKYKKGKK